MINTTELASNFDTTPRTLRKFLRSQGAGVGKGSRYALPSNKRDLSKMRSNFDAWIASREAKSTESDDSPTD